LPWKNNRKATKRVQTPKISEDKNKKPYQSKSSQSKKEPRKAAHTEEITTKGSDEHKNTIKKEQLGTNFETQPIAEIYKGLRDI
jgi:hypothetical protein